jgi:DNA-binding NarL/FixJ family response regulator
MAKIRVVLADDHPIARAGIRNYLEKVDDIEVVGEASDGQEALRLVEEHSPDVLLLDMEMPNIRGLEVARKLQSENSPVRILALSSYDDRQYIFGLLASGASGYMTKEEVPENLIEAIRGVVSGEHNWLSRRVAAKMATWARGESQVGANLTGRELDVLRMVVEGKTNQEAGMALGISEKTVEKYLESVFAKLGVNSRVEAAVRAVRENLV